MQSTRCAQYTFNITDTDSSKQKKNIKSCNQTDNCVVYNKGDWIHCIDEQLKHININRNLEHEHAIKYININRNLEHEHAIKYININRNLEHEHAITQSITPDDITLFIILYCIQIIIQFLYIFIQNC